MGLSISGGTPGSSTICSQEMFVPIFGLKQKLALSVHEPWFQISLLAYLKLRSDCHP